MKNSRALVSLSGIIAIIGGLFMILGGVTSNSFFLWILPLLEKEILERLPSPVSSASILTVYFIALLISLGGITVIIGGLTLLIGLRLMGRVLVALGGGAGVIGLVLALGYYVVVNGLAGVESHLGYWFGVILVVIARWLAGKA